MSVTAQTWRLNQLALAEAGRALAAVVRRRTRPNLRRARPERLLFAPQDLRTGDPTVAAEIFDGLFMFDGATLETAGRSPFALLHPTEAFSEMLFGFGWLRHMRAADTQLARDNARALIADALARRCLDRPPASHPAVVARRLISFLCASPLVLAGANHVFYSRFLREIGRAIVTLDHEVADAPDPLDRLQAAIALAYGALCCAGLESRLKRSSRLLCATLDAQILPDGCHAGRNPAVLVELLLDLLPLRLLYASRGLETPAPLSGAIERMMPMIRYLRLGHGELALMNGMGATAADQHATLLSYDTTQGRPSRRATPSGYTRLEQGATIVIADTGPPPPLDLSATAHAGCLSFEMSSGPQRIVVNCGVPDASGPIREAARTTPAHSTVEINGVSSATFLDPDGGWAARYLGQRLGRVVTGGPDEVALEERGTAEAPILAARHDGFAGRFGLVHERQLALRDGGLRIDGEDRLFARTAAAVGGAHAHARFHLDPAVEPGEPEGGAVGLTLADGERWVFRAEGGEITVEDSVFFAGPEGRRPTAQIVVGFRTVADAGSPATIRWSFAKAPGPQRGSAAEGDQPAVPEPLPLFEAVPAPTPEPGPLPV